MARATARAEAHRRMSGSEFRAFQATRPDHERWELIDGAPVMMTPPMIDHNRIASNLERLLNDALERRDRSREAVQRPGIELGLSAETLSRLGLDAVYRPEPDVAVIDDDPRPGRRFVDRAYLLAEVASSTDDGPLLATGEPWIEAKTRLYRAHASCEAVVVIEQQRVEVRVPRAPAKTGMQPPWRASTTRSSLPRSAWSAVSPSSMPARTCIRADGEALRRGHVRVG
jgi:Uma2 family endonuclease